MEIDTLALQNIVYNLYENEGAGHSGMGGLVGILVGFELRVSGHSLKPTEYKSIILCSKSYIFMVKN